jgi:hypothetical protein
MMILPHRSMSRSCHRDFPVVTMFALMVLFMAMTGCATWQTPGEFDISPLRARAVTEEINGVRLSTTVLSSAESKRMFGADLNKQGVQPIWIEVENTTSQTLWLLRAGTDPDIFSPLEVAWSYHAAFAQEINAEVDAHFEAMAFDPLIAAHSTQSGIIYTNPHRHVRLLNVDLLGQGDLFPFTLFPLIPDGSGGHHARAVMKRFQETEAVDYKSMDALRPMLEQLPCCATNHDGSAKGDPFNVILVGDFDDVSAALVRRGYRVEILHFDNKQYMYDRTPDAVIRKLTQGGAPANWLRLWLAPVRFQGKAVFLAQAGRPVGGRFIEIEEADLMLHPNVDETRNLSIQDMMYSGGLGKLAFIEGVGEIARSNPRSSLDGSSYYTDGLRAVMFFVTRPSTLSDVDILDWHPALKLRESEAIDRHQNGEK